tara:strand:+ start:777 stop:1355 length:579 start_codon:yes stop_codon:yes gene_type:complete
MIQNKLTIKAFYQGKEIKIIPLKNIGYFFDGLDTLGRKWKVKPFTYLLDFTKEINNASLSILIGLLYRRTVRNVFRFNKKRFKNEMLLKNKKPTVFLLEADYLTIPETIYDEALEKLKKIGLIETDQFYDYMVLSDEHSDYCGKLANYLFNTEYARNSIKRNTHYFGSSSSYNHSIALEERKLINIDKDKLH